MNDFPDKLKQFIADSTWIFAKTYAATWPHGYIVQRSADTLVRVAGSSGDISAIHNDGRRSIARCRQECRRSAHIDTHGYESEFYSTRQIYFDFEGNTYWHMGNIINRCAESETYRRRKAEGRLPDDTRKM